MNIDKYIKNHEMLSHLPYIIVYVVILTLITDGYITENVD